MARQPDHWRNNPMFDLDNHSVVSENRSASAQVSHLAEVTWDYDRAEVIADGVVHAIGISFGVVGAITILIVVSKMRAIEIASIAIYTIGLLMMLGLSAAYNMWPISRTKWILRRFDHSAIYLLIAGTYTPFMAQTRGALVPVGILIGVWLTAIVGIMLKVAFPDRLDRLAIVLYLLLGWCGVVAYEPIAAALPSVSLGLLAAGGVLYSTGVVFHLWKTLRFQNAIWHTFVLLAACCHYSAILKCMAFAQF